MSARVAEITARTVTDIRIYAEKAAFEGQALRSLVNGLQARTKYKLSEATKNYAEWCYERKLFDYFQEALRVCLTDDNGVAKAHDILDECEHIDLKSVWAPLFEQCADVLRAKNLESANIRLSKLSLLWDKRSTSSKWLASMSKYWVKYVNDYPETAERIDKEIKWAIDGPKNLFVADSEEALSNIENIMRTSVDEKSNQILILANEDDPVEWAFSYVYNFRAIREETLHVVFPTKNDACSFFEKLEKANEANTEDNTEYILNEWCGSPTECIVITSIEYLSTTEKSKKTPFHAVLFVGLERAELNGNINDEEEVVNERQCNINDLIVEIHIWGNIILRQMEEFGQLYLAEKMEGDKTEQEMETRVTNILRTWPKPIQDCITQDDMCKYVKFPCQRHQVARQAIQRKAESIVTERYPSNVPIAAYHYVESFFEAKKLKFDENYCVVVEQDKRKEPSLRVKSRGKHTEGTWNNFLELKHGCELSSPIGNKCVIDYASISENCSFKFVILRAYDFIPSKQEEEEMDVDSIPDEPLYNAYELMVTPRSCQYVISTKPAVKISNLFRVVTVTSQWKDVPTLVGLKRQLYCQHRTIKRQAMMVHLLREPLGPGDSSPCDLRSDRFVEHALVALEYIAKQISKIDQQLAEQKEESTHEEDGSLQLHHQQKGWPAPSAATVDRIARTHGIKPEVDLRKYAEEAASETRNIHKVQQEIADYLKPVDKAVEKWEDLKLSRLLTNAATVFALSPDNISEATHLLHDLTPVEGPPQSTRIQLSNRYLNDCTFYKISDDCREFDDRALLALGASREHIATSSLRNLGDANDQMEICIVGTTHHGQPLYLYPQNVCDRLLRDLVESATIPCELHEDEVTKQKWQKIFSNNAYHDILPMIYNPTLTKEEYESKVASAVMTELQGAMIDFGTHEWMDWYMQRLVLFQFDDSVLSYYRRNIAEREFCLRDEILIKRFREALGTEERANSHADSRMDAFVFGIVEKITRGERLVEIDPPFKDKVTADNLARFIRSRRMHPEKKEKTENEDA